MHPHESDEPESRIDYNETQKKDGETSKVSTQMENKERGSVKWRVYLEYLRAGAGILLGLLLLLFFLTTREATYVFSTWWLATWNEDENERHPSLTNCTTDLRHSSISNMTDQQWNSYRNHLFYIYSS